MQIYKVDDHCLKTLVIDGPIKIHEEYFWTDDRIKLLCQAVERGNRNDVHIELNVYEHKSALSITDNAFRSFGLLRPKRSLTLQLSGWGNKNTQITHLSLVYLGIAFQNLVHLDLNLSNWGHLHSKIGSLGIVNLFTSLPPTLESLSLNLNNMAYRTQEITGQCLIPVGDRLKQLQRLRDLNLGLANWGNDYNKSLGTFNNDQLIYLLNRLAQMELVSLSLDLTKWGGYGSAVGEESALKICELLEKGNLTAVNISLEGWLIGTELKQELRRKARAVNSKKVFAYIQAALEKEDLCIREGKLVKILQKIF